MGCCVSTKTTSPRQSIPASTLHNAGSKSPPPIDEETVKEVLSETKLPPPPIPGLHGSGRMVHQNGGAAAFGKDDHSHLESEIHITGNDAAFRWPGLDTRPFPGETKREKTAGRSPARRSVSSPGRAKTGSMYIRGMPAGESSGRRSRSPVIRSDPGSSKMGLRKRVGSGESIRKWEEEEKEHEEMTRAPPTTANELLENSFVSLECFIFL